MSTDSEQIYTGFDVGDGLGLVSDSTFALLETTNGALAERLWELIEDGAGVDELLEELSTRGLRSLGSFALAQIEGVGLRVVVRGDAVAVVDTGSTSERFEATGVKTWLEHVVDHCVHFSLVLGTDSESTRSPYRVSRALLPAVSLHRPASAGLPRLQGLDLTELRGFVVPLDDAAHDTDHEITGTHAPSDTAGVPDAEVASAGQIEESAPLDSGAIEPDTGSVDDTMSGDDRDGDASQPTPGPPPESAPTEVSETVTTSGDTMHISNFVDDGAGDSGYDDLYGHTVHKSVQSAAVVSQPDDDAQVVEPIASPSPPLPAPEPAPPVVAPAAGGLISGVPGAAPASGPVPLAEGDHDGMTISVAHLSELRRGGGVADPAQPTMGGPTVQALICASGHPNPPQAGACQRCSAPLSATQTTIARPSMGRITMSTGAVIELTRPAIVGRNPKVEGRLPSEVPQTIRIDVGQALSRSHMMVRLEGWQVLVEDLGSANGTTVTLPGRPPRLLHSGEPILLEHGALIDLGGEVTGTYEFTG